MGELTKTTAKPLLRVKGKPLMEYVIDLLVVHGVKEIGVNLNYRGHEIASYFGDGSRFGAQITYVHESTLTGTAGGVRSVAGQMQLSNPFFVISSDMLVNFDLSALAAAQREHGGVGTLSCYFRPKDELKKSGVMLFNEQTKEIRKFVERPQKPEDIISQWVNSSVYAFSPEILTFIPQTVEGSPVVDLPRDVFPQIFKAGKKLFAHPFPSETFYQLGIDTPDRIARAERDLESGVYAPTQR